ncbi:MAG TPA: hypothetical protein DCK99_12125 [Blastocatellia bacterium]|nr:hypothetical protein [Blastocatellia bacterium]
MHSFRFKLPHVVVVLTSLLTLVAAAQSSLKPSDWETLTPEGEEFSVFIPRGSTLASGKETYHKMGLNMRVYLSNPTGGPIFAVVSMSGIKSNPAMYSEMQRVNSYVDAFKDLFPARVRKDAIAKLTLVGEKTLQGNAGREYRLTVADLSGTAQVYATRKRFYAIVYLNTKKEDAWQQQFLGSFILPEKVAETPTIVASQNPATAPPANRSVPADVPSEGSVTPIDETKPDEPDRAGPQIGERAPISGGVLNNKATSLPQPVFPPAAAQAKASGTVVVQVIVDEQGNVISAHAISGHPLLQAAAVAAARQAKFQPTFLMGEPVKVNGVITYNFVRPER